jgi:peptide/nickel transport system substrate-binding protein
MKRMLLLAVLSAVLAIALVACGGDEAPAAQIIEVPGETIIIEKEVIVEVPVEVVVEREVIREVRVPGETVIVEKIVEVMAATTFGEAPMLAQLVLAGQLPPVEERLPDEPMVMPVFGEIGKYGGTLRRGFLGPTDVNCNVGRLNGTGPVRWNTAGTEIIPWVAKSIKGNADGSEWTMELRKGMRWSDGAPFTADDFIFQSIGVHGNDEIKPGKQLWYKGPYDEFVKVSKVDDTTVKFTYPGPNYIFAKMMLFSCSNFNMPFAPKHHLEQFHIEFNPDADKLAKEAGFDSWVKHYLNREDFRDNLDRPSTRPWLFRNTRGDPTIILERNPFFLAVDPEGNQLPYIDKVRLGLVETPEVLMLQAIQGDIDFQGRHIQLPNFPVLKENEDKGGYNVQLVNTYGGNDAFVTVNQGMPGEIGDLLRNKTFRLGLAAAIDRDFINKTALLGLGTVRNAIPPPGHPHHPGPEYETKNLVYDVDLANKLLDEVIPNKGSDGFRTLPSGESFEYLVGATPAFGPWPDVAEQAARFFQAIGVNAKAHVVERSLLRNQWRANEIHAHVWNYGRTADVFFSPWTAVPLSVANLWAPMIGVWFASDGKDGVEPSDEIKQIVAWYKEGLTVPPEESAKLAQKIYKWHVENQVLSGVAGMSPMVMGVVVVNQDLGNVPESWANAVVFNTPWPSFPEQFYFKR